MDKIRTEIEDRIRELKWSTSSQNIIDLIQPSVQISANTGINPKIGNSKFGGLPDLVNTAEWPMINQKPLAFLGQIDFSEIEHIDLVPHILRDKLVSFFISGHQEHYRQNNPIIHKTYITQAELFEKLSPISFPNRLSETFQFPEKQLVFQDSLSIPSYQHWKIEQLELNEGDEELYADEVVDIFNEYLGLNYRPGHQLFGYSDAIQGDTNSSWAAKHLNCNAFPMSEEFKNTEMKYEQLVQFDLMQGFNSISSGCAYFGYIEEGESVIEIQCELQNT